MCVFKSLCDSFLVAKINYIKTKNENLVILSEDEYNEFIKAKRNADYLAMIDKSMAET